MATKKSTVNAAGNYTKPTMRKALFEKIKAGTKGAAAAFGAPATISAGGFFTLRFYQATNSWYRIA
jgi:hypothetical protein